MKLSYPEALPVSRHRDEIGRAMLDHQVVIVCGDTGSGKTTQLPKIALEVVKAAQGIAGTQPGRIGCTQPRRIAATSVATRVAEEMSVECGKEVGYQIRFQDRTSESTMVKFMTDGILLAETQRDALLRQYSVLIIDEAHERSLNVDFILGYLSQILPKRPDLKVVISSATLDATSFSVFFGGAPVISVEGRTFPVTVEYMPAEHQREQLREHVFRAAKFLGQLDPLGDTLVFLPGEREIRECAELLEGRRLPHSLILPLFARQAGQEQQQVFRPMPSRRRIILATNVAETSLTIPDIRSVIDSGIARVNRFHPSSGIQRLQIEKVSQASANQRKGRCGRVSEGVCLRLYEEEDFDSRAEFTDPEILRTNLAGVVLSMEHLGLGAPQDFPFLDPPQPNRVTQAYRTLEEIGAIRKGVQKKGSHPWELTRIGKTLARLPLDPRIGRLLLGARDQGCLREGIVIAAALTVQDPKERPQDKQTQADQAHAKFRDDQSDFTSWLRLWHALDKARREAKSSNNGLRRFGKSSFLNFRRTQEWINLHREIRSVLRGMKWDLPDERKPMDDPKGSYSEALHRAILTSIPSQIGMHIGKKGKGYKGARDREFFIHPASNLKGATPVWVMAFEVVETTRLYARNLAKFDPAWVEKCCPHVVSYRHSGAEWNEDAGVVYGKERVTAYGLVLEEGRRIHYGRLVPDEARRIFIWEALIHGRTKRAVAGLEQHWELRDRIEWMEHKLRRREGLVFPEAIFDFYDSRLPAEVCTVKGFEEWIKTGPENFELTVDDCIFAQTEPVTDEGFPDHLDGPQGSEVEDSRYPLTYLHAIDEDERNADGVTVEIPIDELGQLPSWFGSWLVPGLLPQRAESLLRSLPKDSRRMLPPMSEVVEAFLASWDGYAPQLSLTEALANHLEDDWELPISASSFDEERVPVPLQIRYLIRDAKGRALRSGRDFPALQGQMQERIEEHFSKVSQQNDFHRDEIRAWDFGTLPETVALGGGRAGYPALCVLESGCGLRVFATAEEAEWHHLRGLAALLRETAADVVGDLRRALAQGSSARSSNSAPRPRPAASNPLPSSGFSLGDAFGDLGSIPTGPAQPANVKDEPEELSPTGAGLLCRDDVLQLRAIGSDPSTHLDDFVDLILREVLGSGLPDDAESFQALVAGLHGPLFASAERLCPPLRSLLEATRSIIPALAQDAPGYSESTTDLRHQFSQLLRPGWLAEMEPDDLPRAARYFRGIEVRHTRMLGSPPARDETKMERFWSTQELFEDRWATGCPCGRDHWNLEALADAQAENDARLHHFAPEVR